MPKFLLPTPLRPYAGGAATVEVAGRTVAGALESLVGRHEGLRKHLYDEAGRLRSFINIYKNDEDVRYLEKDGTPVSDGDALSIIPSIAGGSPAPPPVADPSALSNEEIRRYSRHLIMPEVGMEGQKKLKAARVLAVGTGGLGSPLSLYLAAAGVGTLGLVDYDVVDDSNLQRQILFGVADIGRPKLDAAEERLRGVNPHVSIVKFEERLTSENALRIIRDFDIVADGTDNFPTRYLVNDACVFTGKPNVYASFSVSRGRPPSSGREKGPCYRCLCRAAAAGPRPVLRRGGVLGILPGLGHPGDRDDQAHSRVRRPAHRPAAPRGRPRHAVPGVEAPQEPRLRHLRKESDGHEAVTTRPSAASSPKRPPRRPAACPRSASRN
jgi:adenylyltransferase/sulfurtransferase